MNVTIDITDNATPRVRELMEKMSPRQVGAAVGRPVAQAWRNALKVLPPNKQGFPSTGFWEDAARSVTWTPIVDGVLFSADKQGLNQRLHGGAITAGEKALTIAARSEYYGHGATEFQNLQLIVFKSGAMALAEVVGRGKRGGKKTGLIAYWLVGRGHSTRPQAPNPAVLPLGKLTAVAQGAIERSVLN
jgi:hypothetical protein